MQQNTNLKLFDEWVTWKDNSFALGVIGNGKLPNGNGKLPKNNQNPKQYKNTITSICVSLGLRPGMDFQVTMYEVRFRQKSFLAMFKLNFING